MSNAEIFVIPNTEIQKIMHWLDNGSINLFGRPFSGKDTQAYNLASLFGANVIGGGEIIRNSQNTALKQAVSGGKLAPTREYLNLVLPYFKQQQYKDKPLILNSVGRWHGEEQSVLKALSASGHKLKAVILLDIDESEVKKRHQATQKLKDRGGRTDDVPDALDVRLDEFQNKTVPVIEFYRRNGLLIEVDGSKKPQEVTSQILIKLKQMQLLD